jgi:hypothetical protein
MNTTIIIVLAVLILIVVLAIVFILIKGKSKDSDVPQDSSPMTFQEEDDTEQTIEPELTTPQLHTQENTPTPQPPAIDDLTTPQQTPSVQPGSTPSTIEDRPTIEESLNEPTQVPQQGPVQQGPNPLPDSSQIDQDLANLQTTSTSNNDMENLANSVNDSIQTTYEDNEISEDNNRIMGDAVPPVPQQDAPTVETTEDKSPPAQDNDTMNVQNQGYNAPQQPEQQTPVQPQGTPSTEDIQNQGYNPPPEPIPTQPSQTPQPPQQDVNTNPPIPITPENPNSPIHTPPQDNPVNP